MRVLTRLAEYEIAAILIRRKSRLDGPGTEQQLSSSLLFHRPVPCTTCPNLQPADLYVISESRNIIATYSIGNRSSCVPFVCELITFQHLPTGNLHRRHPLKAQRQVFRDCFLQQKLDLMRPIKFIHFLATMGLVISLHRPTTRFVQQKNVAANLFSSDLEIWRRRTLHSCRLYPEVPGCKVMEPMEESKVSSLRPLQSRRPGIRSRCETCRSCEPCGLHTFRGRLDANNAQRIHRWHDAR